jgi:hypothetical protein
MTTRTLMTTRRQALMTTRRQTLMTTSYLWPTQCVDDVTFI